MIFPQESFHYLSKLVYIASNLKVLARQLMLSHLRCCGLFRLMFAYNPSHGQRASLDKQKAAVRRDLRSMSHHAFRTPLRKRNIVHYMPGEEE